MMHCLLVMIRVGSRREGSLHSVCAQPGIVPMIRAEVGSTSGGRCTCSKLVDIAWRHGPRRLTERLRCVLVRYPVRWRCGEVRACYHLRWSSLQRMVRMARLSVVTRVDLPLCGIVVLHGRRADLWCTLHPCWPMAHNVLATRDRRLCAAIPLQQTSIKGGCITERSSATALSIGAVLTMTRNALPGTWTRRCGC